MWTARLLQVSSLIAVLMTLSISPAKGALPTSTSIVLTPGQHMALAYKTWQVMRKNPETYRKNALSAQIASYKAWKHHLALSKQEKRNQHIKAAEQMATGFKNWWQSKEKNMP